MAIAVTCPSCGFDGEAPDETAGQTVLCPDCRFNIPVPGKSKSSGDDRFRDEPPPKRRDDDRPSRRRDEDDDDDDDRPSRRRSSRRRGGYGETVCRNCGSDAPPVSKSQISAAGWTVFVLLLLCFWPLCFIGLLMKDEWKACRDCGTRL